MTTLGRALLRIAKARIRYYRAMGELKLSFIQNAIRIGVDATREAAGQEPPEARSEDRFKWGDGGFDRERDERGAESVSRVLLEGAAGEKVTAAFGVENSMDEPCTATFRVSPSADLPGIDQLVEFSPPEVHLQVGEQAVITIAATIAETMEVEASYLAEIEVVGPPSSRIPIVLRRRRDAGAVEGSSGD